MSDSIKNLPIDEYSNPTKEEIQILDTLFPKQTTVVQIKISILASLLYIVCFLINQKFKSKIYVLLCSLFIFASLYLIQIHVIR